MNKNLANNIKRWKEFEQKLRFQAGKDFAKNHKTGVYNYMVYLIDAINNLRIKEIIKECGFPPERNRNWQDTPVGALGPRLGAEQVAKNLSSPSYQVIFVLDNRTL